MGIILLFTQGNFISFLLQICSSLLSYREEENPFYSYTTVRETNMHKQLYMVH